MYSQTFSVLILGDDAIFYFHIVSSQQREGTQAQCRAVADRSRHKSYRRIQYRIFQSNPQIVSLLFPSFYLRKTYTKMVTCHGFISNHESPFMGPIKIDQRNVKHYLPFTMVVLK